MNGCRFHQFTSSCYLPCQLSGEFSEQRRVSQARHLVDGAGKQFAAFMGNFVHESLGWEFLNGVRLVFEYYNRLSARRQSIYRQSDEIKQVPLPRCGNLPITVAELEGVLKSDNRHEVEKLCQRIADEIVSQLEAPAIRIQVLAVRPSDDWGELHGLYLPEDDGASAQIQLWMRTAKHKRVVAFRSFLRTLLHELCHHLDYELFHFPETFHTEGFYNRESSLFHQLVPEASVRKSRNASNKGPRR